MSFSDDFWALSVQDDILYPLNLPLDLIRDDRTDATEVKKMAEESNAKVQKNRELALFFTREIFYTNKVLKLLFFRLLT